MKIIKNEKLIKRNGQIGQYTSIGALVVLGVGMYISFTKPNLFTWSIDFACGRLRHDANRHVLQQPLGT